MREVVIVSACRTPIGSFGGTIKDIPVVELGKIVIEEVVKRANIKPDTVDEVICGCVLQTAQGQNVTRQALIKAGLPVTIPGMTINKVCGSGLRVVGLAAQIIKAGDADCIVAGGMESMSNAPYALTKARYGYRMGDGTIIDTMVNDGLCEVSENIHMGITAENVNEQYKITREEQDEFAFQSQERAAAAISAGKFKDEIIPVVVKNRKGDIVFDTDEFPRQTSDLDLIEANEAFAAQSIAVARDMGWVDMDKVNVNGGAIALGHPIGASGNRILVSLLHEMKKRGSKYGLATLCIGGGMGTSLIVENLQ